ncbi:uncharacterized protein LOC121378197 [Gigantopelta aegis]|uniref:uncharacterized protein LOC121378197 n=1 Tax=Gigantopelta aegis TaxID=1735272 RepID=UPI001B887A3B|nr:uncharacterized protein LOC121378197 [Gigantopelta aegis]
MQRRCQEKGLVVGKETVRILMSICDPTGVAKRKKRRLSLRNYYSKGPNALWHMDGYDKIKPYGICIHGCVDGFSRAIIWLHASTTNNNPKVITSYFIDAVKRLKGCPERIRSDKTVEQLQKFLRWEHTDRFSRDNY